MRAVFLVAALRLADDGCSGTTSDPQPPVDASADASVDATVGDAPAPGTPCVTRADCDDGLFCTGVEECLAGVCVSARNAACRASCADVACSESGGGCVLTPRACSEDVPCSGDAECDDARSCTDDVCVSGRCAHLPVDARCPTSGACGVGVCLGDAVADPSGCSAKPDAAKCKTTEGCVDLACVPLTSTCTSDRDCADGTLCDGVERCVDGRCQHGARTSCVAGACQHAECSNSGVGDPWCRIVGLARCP
jgi:hypothetical protein